MLRTEKLPVFQVQIPHPLPSEFLDCSSKAPSPSRHPGLGVASKNHFSPERHASPQTRAPGQNVSQADLRAPRAPAMHPSAQKPGKKKKTLKLLSQLWNLISTYPCISQAAWSAFTGLLQSLGLLPWALKQQGHSHVPSTVVVFQLLSNIWLFMIPWTAAH